MSGLSDWLQGYRTRIDRGELGFRSSGSAAGPITAEEVQAEAALQLARLRLPEEQLLRAEASASEPFWFWSDATRWLLRVASEPRWLRGDDACACCCGDEGLGKTQGLVLAGLRLARAGKRLAYLPAYEADCRRAWARWEAYETADVLLLDELHRLDTADDVTVGRVIGLIDVRYRRHRPLLACATCPPGRPGTSTEPPTGLHRILGSEVVARFSWLSGFAGESYRRRIE